METVGDCYVAAAGVPDARPDHAVVMASFSRACLRKMRVVAQKLEVVLGPDTGDLKLRVGLHRCVWRIYFATRYRVPFVVLTLSLDLCQSNSGQVTAGVLRGERARFQLYGDVSHSKFQLIVSTAMA